jgi:hypothetical protein
MRVDELQLSLAFDNQLIYTELTPGVTGERRIL